MSEQLESYHDHLRLLRLCAGAISSLAASFDHIGNPKVASDLWALRDDITKARKGVEAFVAGEMDDRLKDSREMTRAVLGATLAGIRIGSTDASQ